MDIINMDKNSEVVFHPVNEDKQAIAENKAATAANTNKIKVIEHLSAHYRKYLFWIWTLCGFLIALIGRMFFGTSTTISTTSAGYTATTDTAYESLAPEVKAVIIFNQMDAIAHEKDNFFHQIGKIYTLSGETLFHKYDTMFHVLDNAYHRAVDTQEKLKRARRLENFINIQNDIFAATTYTNPQQDEKFAQLDQEFIQTLAQIELDKMSTTMETTTTTTETVTTNEIAQ